jgi:hypothetical protein
MDNVLLPSWTLLKISSFNFNIVVLFQGPQRFGDICFDCSCFYWCRLQL